MNLYDSFLEEHVVETTATQKQFWNAINLWNERPNIVNKKLFGIEMITKFQIKSIEYIDNVINILRVIIEGADVLISKTIIDRLKASCNDYLYFNNGNDTDICVYVKKLLPKILNLKIFTEVEVTIFDYINNKATFFNIFSMNNKCIETDHVDDNINYEKLSHCYQITYKQFLHHNELKDVTSSHISLSFGNPISHHKSICISSFNSNKDWLKNKLLCKIVKWSEEDDSNNNQIDEKSTSVCKSGSLRLISINEYCALYQKLKKMYGKKFVEIWPENTDPLKFVYEDVAIATYLLLLWGDKKQTFVDMGCGNGLLVHILTCEGHVGVGFDVRARKIWELYPSGTADLQVKTIVPTVDDSCLYPAVDWLIGNHSDELTPWIPVIASLSSYKCNYFILPCCSYELNGQKYQRQNSSKSQYMDYLDYIGSLCDHCGFSYEFDKLRIPSTKRICIVSCGRNYSESDHEIKVSVVRDLVKLKCCSSDHINVNDSEKNNVYDNFKTRSSEIKVRNCTQLDKNFVEHLVILISKKLLIQSSSLDEDEKLKKPVNCNNNKNVWNEGHPIKLNELAKSIPGEYLKQLKKECGGLQTLIKNHHYIFKIDKGMVYFRKPLKSNRNVSTSFISKSNKVITIRNREANLKKKICWFNKNHPDKCPLNNDECSFVHS